MPSDHPRKPFNLRANGQSDAPKTDDKAPDEIRDKDNAAPRMTPPAGVHYPAFNLAAPGTLGIRRNLPGQQIDAAKPVSLAKQGDLKRTFTPIAKPDQDKDRGR